MNLMLRRLLRAILWIAGIWAALIILIELVMSSSLMTKTVQRIASEYIDGDVGFGRASLSMFRKFPDATITLDDFSLTYPADRFEDIEKTGPQGYLLYKGNGEDADTLASFRRFSASVNIWALLTGKISITDVQLTRPRIFAHMYPDGRANWDIFVSDTTESAQDTTSGRSLPKIDIGRIRLTERPHIVYTDSRDTIFAMISIRNIGFDGRLTTGKVSRNKIGLTVDSMFVAGRIAADTMALGLDRLHLHEHRNHIDFNASAKALAATRHFGRMQIPVGLEGTVHFPKDTVPALAIHGFRGEIAAIPLEGDLHLRKLDGRTGIEGSLAVKECRIDDIRKEFLCNFIPEASKISTDAIMSIEAVCNDEYIHGSGVLPSCSIRINLPEASVSHTSLPHKVRLAMDAGAQVDRNGKVSISVDNALVRTTGLSVSAKGGASDILSDDPLMDIDGHMNADLASLASFLPESSDITAEGVLSADINGKARLSHIGLYTFSKSELTGSIAGERIIFKSPSDTIDIDIEGLKASIGPENKTSKRDTTLSFRLMGISGNIQKADIAYKDALTLNGADMTFSAKSTTDNDTTRIGRLGGRISAARLSVKDGAGSSVNLDETSNGFQVMPKRSNPKIPVLTLTSTTKRITLATDVNRAILTDASIRADASMNSIERKQMRKARLDSLQKVYPDIPRDSLMRHAMKNRPAREVQEWLKEEDFRKRDIDIRLDQSIAKYFREWDMRGAVKIRTGIIMTPYFPLRNILRGCEVTFDNDRIGIDSIKVLTGSSNVMAKGELTGLRRALTARNASSAIMNLKVNLSTDKMNANEILSAYSAGSNFNPDASREEMAGATNAEFLQMVVSDTTESDEKARLLVIPANLNADISVNGKEIRYSDLLISDLNAAMKMKERCVQITNTSAISNMGEVSFEGFYATRSKRDIRAGFNFDFKDITTEKVIALMPSVDTIMPLLKSFAGQLNCNLAATASLDTNMNIITPTINGVIRISGDDLTIRNSDMFTSLAKKLHFSDNKVGKINRMTVEGVIMDNILEVFPFVLKMDKYTLALSGKQNLDLSYRYHASLIRSPMLIKVGVDIYGKDFDHMKFKIGKPKYRNENVPVFTAVIDETRINLAESIRSIFAKGVEAAVQENERQEAIAELKQEIGYVNAVDQELEELSSEEQKMIEETQETDNNESSDNQQDE